MKYINGVKSSSFLLFSSLSKCAYLYMMYRKKVVSGTLKLVYSKTHVIYLKLKFSFLNE